MIGVIGLCVVIAAFSFLAGYLAGMGSFKPKDEAERKVKLRRAVKA